MWRNNNNKKERKDLEKTTVQVVCKARAEQGSGEWEVV
jgi:hypothetical protein